jgi:hypothetical protein
MTEKVGRGTRCAPILAANRLAFRWLARPTIPRRTAVLCDHDEDAVARV